jgi:extracellular factor (EF) 3-hydroxypalmitic acid methyl ester biosynthesis protein
LDKRRVEMTIEASENNAADIEKEIRSFVDFLPLIADRPCEAFDEEFNDRLDRIEELSHSCSEKRQRLMKYCYDVTSGELNKSLLQRQARTKPMGYPGDHLIIDWIYGRKADSPGRGLQWDRFFQRQPAAQAVRNRKDYFCAVFESLHGQRRGLSVLDIACGPCRDVADALSKIDDDTGETFLHCVDSDPQAIAYARGVVNGGSRNVIFQLEAANAFRIRPSRHYDLVWSAGLFDYLDDRQATALLRTMWRWTAVGGTLIAGNFHPGNPSRNYMEWLGDWFLVYRAEEDLRRLCELAGIPKSCVSFDREPLGVNIFCKAVKS